MTPPQGAKRPLPPYINKIYISGNEWDIDFLDSLIFYFVVVFERKKKRKEDTKYILGFSLQNILFFERREEKRFVFAVKPTC